MFRLFAAAPWNPATDPVQHGNVFQFAIKCAFALFQMKSFWVVVALACLLCCAMNAMAPRQPREKKSDEV